MLCTVDLCTEIPAARQDSERRSRRESGRIRNSNQSNGKREEGLSLRGDCAAGCEAPDAGAVPAMSRTHTRSLFITSVSSRISLQVQRSATPYRATDNALLNLLLFYYLPYITVTPTPSSNLSPCWAEAPRRLGPKTTKDNVCSTTTHRRTYTRTATVSFSRYKTTTMTMAWSPQLWMDRLRRMHEPRAMFGFRTKCRS